MVDGGCPGGTFDREPQEVRRHRVRADAKDEHVEQSEEAGRAEGQETRTNAVGPSRMPSDVVKATDGLPQRRIGCDDEEGLAKQVANDALAETVAAEGD